MEHRPVGDRPRQIDRAAAARRVAEHHGTQAPLVVEPDIVVDTEIMALAGHQHVVVAVKPQLGRTAGGVGRQRRDDRDMRGLALLAAEGPAHPAHLDRHGIVGKPQSLGHDLLHLAGVLGRG
jgi:hypothetical protein